MTDNGKPNPPTAWDLANPDKGDGIARNGTPSDSLVARLRAVTHVEYVENFPVGTSLDPLCEEAADRIDRQRMLLYAALEANEQLQRELIAARDCVRVYASHAGELEAAEAKVEQLQRERDIAGGKFADERRHYIAANARAEAAESRLARITHAGENLRDWASVEHWHQGEHVGKSPEDHCPLCKSVEAYDAAISTQPLEPTGTPKD